MTEIGKMEHICGWRWLDTERRERDCILGSVTRLGNLLHFGQLFKTLRHCLFCPNYPYFSAFFEKMSKSFIFQVKSFLGNFYRHLATFNWSHWSWVKALARPHVFTCTHNVSDLKNQISNIRQQSTQKQFVTRNLFEFTIWHA